MEHHLCRSILTVVFFITLTSSDLLPIPEVHFEDKIYDEEDTKITCSIEYTNCSDVNLDIKSNVILRDCEQKSVNQSNEVTTTKKTCLLSVTRSMDQTEFKCEAHFKTQSKSKIMRVHTEPEFTDCPNKVVWKEHEENSFHCKATGYPQPTVTCMKGNVIYSEGVKYKTLRNMTGAYTCVAINSLDKDSRTVDVSVEYKPQVLSIKVNPPLHNEGDTVTITCEADGKPAPVYSWNMPSFDVQFSPDNRTITVQKMTKSHLGKYKCSASNKHGQNSLEEELTLTAKPKVLSINVYPSIDVMENENLTLTCEARGIPPPTYSWNYPTSSVLLSPDNRTINILAVQTAHAGDYSCTAQNKHGRDTMTKKITVTGKGSRMDLSVILTILSMLMSTSLMYFA